MKKEKLNRIKLNIIAMILTLICTSCAPFSKIDPKANENTNLGKNTNPEKTTNLRKNIDLEKN
ncbi:complement regulator-acquiring protein, partial [Borreliella burgdorferi]